jgi:DNA-binding MarR family transcriptional regulator
VPQTKNAAQEFILETFLPYRLSLLSNTVSQVISNAYRKAYGLSVTEWRVVAVLGRFPGLIASEIVQRTAMDKVAISRAVKALQERGLVERSPHSEDRRRLPLRLTPDAGIKLFRAVVPKALAFEAQLLSALDAQEKIALDRLLVKLQTAAESLSPSQGA